MLTKTFDFIKVMCMQYWPSAKVKNETYGNLTISVEHEEELANFHIRTIRIVLKEGSPEEEHRKILQFHYTEWPCHTCPFSNAILEFRRRMRAVVGTYRTQQHG
ncbi:tyrosine-protein phosphatase 9-like, partial [Diaphorina citri]|uniref:Tyrosine-protein phosphatase 9-like n=1 Tax=Diaphorina citri TaxID=121845 RepID=A0A1S3DR47_DIACI